MTDLFDAAGAAPAAASTQLRAGAEPARLDRGISTASVQSATG